MCTWLLYVMLPEIILVYTKCSSNSLDWIFFRIIDCL